MKLAHAIQEELDWVIPEPADTEVSLDLIDDEDTADEATPSQREESYIGTLPREEDNTFAALQTRHAELATAVGALEKACVSFDSVDVSARAAETSLRRRAGRLALIANALGGVIDFAVHPDIEPLFRGDGALAPYLAGVYLWTGEVTDVLTIVAHDLNALNPDWAAMRARLGEVSWLYDMALAEQARLDESDVFSITDEDLAASLDHVMVGLVSLKRELEEPFG